MPTRIREHIRSHVIGYLAIFLGLGGVAYAAIPSESGVFTGCYATTNGVVLNVPHSKGDLRVVEPNEACRSHEKKVTWNREGQPGMDGQDGQDGVSGYEVVVGDIGTIDTLSTDPHDHTFTLAAVCPEGKKALGGGWRLVGSTGPTPRYEIQNNTISPSSDRAWFVTVADVGQPIGGTISFRAVVTCATVN